MQFVSRSEWGARPPKGDYTYVETTHGVKVHYEGTYVPLSLVADHARCAPRMRDLQASHMANTTENYIDIAYSSVVCPHGYEFEGRGLHHKTGANGNATLNMAHYAVCGMVGSSGLTEPTAEQLNGIRDAIERYRRSGGAGQEIKGHRDGYATSCPGGPLYTWVQGGALRPGGDPTPPVTPAPEPQPAPTPARYQVTINGLVYGYGAYGDHITTVGQALVEAGFGAHYVQGPGPSWTDADTENYADFQRSLGYQGGDADGVPGLESLRRLLGYLPSARPIISTAHIRAAAFADPPAEQGHVTYGAEVQVVEQALADEGLLDRSWIDGSFGTRTVYAYATLQRRYGYSGSGADGIPGKESLTRLGHDHGFTVVD